MIDRKIVRGVPGELGEWKPEDVGNYYVEGSLSTANRNLLNEINTIYSVIANSSKKEIIFDNGKIKIDWKRIDWEWDDGTLLFSLNQGGRKIASRMNLMFTPQQYFSPDWKLRQDLNLLTYCIYCSEKAKPNNTFRRVVFIEPRGYPKEAYCRFYFGCRVDKALVLEQFGLPGKWWMTLNKEPWQMGASYVEGELCKFFDNSRRLETQCKWDDVVDYCSRRSSTSFNFR